VTPRREEPYWPAYLAILAAIVLHIALPDRVTVIPDWIVPAAEGLLFVALLLAHLLNASVRRPLNFTLIGLVVAANTVTLGALVNYLLDHRQAQGSSLLLSGVDIYVTGILIFAVLFWELDRGGPEGRTTGGGKRHFRFAQEEPAVSGWRVGFVDYLYLSFTNSTAFSPTDTMPLTPQAKLLMLIEGLAALATAAVVLARAVSQLGV
jgi:hypothetical protein